MKSDERLEDIANIASQREKYPPIVMRFMLQACAREILPDEKVAVCMRVLAPFKSRVEVRKREGGKRAFYANLVVCARIWFCPVCAARISEKRRQELSYAITQWRGGVVMLTYTFSHSKSDKLVDGLKGLKDSFRFMKSGRQWEEIKEWYGWNGSVKALEVTYGKSGWHCHIHELVFLTNELSAQQEFKLEHAVYARWWGGLQRSGLFASSEHGVKLTANNAHISDYVAKFGDERVQTEEEMKRGNWTLAHEITKQVVKKANLEGKTPMQLLTDYWNGDMLARKLWKEYADAFKGSHQLQWSRGIRELLHMRPEEDDETLAQETTKDSLLLASLSAEEWRAVLRADVRGQVLHHASNDTPEEFSFWISDLLVRWKD